jgi:PAS domain S-box-containing protein
MWHIALPIMAGGRHLATLFLSQFFFEGEVLDREQFIRQAHEFGFDKDEYLAALDRTPVFGREKVEYILSYDKALVRFISDLAEQALKVIETRESLLKSEERFRRLIESVTDYIYTVKVAGGRAVSTQHGSACIAVTGYSSEEYEANHDLWYQMVYDEDRDAVLQQINLAMSGKPALPLEHRIIHKNGSVIWVRHRIVPSFNKSGELVAYDGMIRDITERKNAEYALKESEERYRLFLKDFPGVAFKRTIDLKPVFFHGAIEKITGYREEEFMSEEIRWHKIVHPGDLPMHFEKIADLQSIPNYSLEREYRILRKDGQIRWLKELIQNKCDESGSPAFIQGTIYDITDQKKLEEQLQHAQKTEAIGQLAGGVAHDFNNILSAMIGFATLAQMKMKEDDPAKKYLSRIFELSDKAAKLTGSLLAFSRKQVINIRPLKLNEIVNNTCMLIARVIGEDIKLDIKLSDEDMVIMTDSIQLDQILVNLATNARDAMPEGGTLTISTSVLYMDDEFIRLHGHGNPGQYALMQVEDTGSGMDENTRNRIFDPFFTTKEVGKGTGLGLAIVYGIIKQHNGYIDVYSEARKGTIFKMYLPMLNIDADISVSADMLPLKGGAEVILVAEDEQATRESLKGMLEEYGYRVVEAKDGQDAVNKFNEQKDHISLVLMDVVMPIKSGKEAFNEIREINPNARIIFTSGYTGDMVKNKGIVDSGAQFISKPVSPNELLAKIRQALDDGYLPRHQY